MDMKTWADIAGELGYIVKHDPSPDYVFKLETFDDLLKRDEQREKDGFKKKIKIGKIGKGGKNSVVIVPTTTEDKLLHSPFDPNTEESTGGEGEGEEGDVIGEKSIDEGEGEGEGEEEGEGGAGSGGGGDHGLDREMYETGKILTEQFELPNIKDKGKKVAIPQWKYDLTDSNRRTGQVLDKRKTLFEICKTNISLSRLDKDKRDAKNFVVRPEDKIYRVLSRERMYESQAVVFLCRDYSGSMSGKPTEIVVKQHMMIYAWLMYQYSEKVIPRFILHDTEAKEVFDFNTYHRSKVMGGTKIASAYKLINDIIEGENLERDYNIYVIYGSDGDNWKDSNNETVEELEKMMGYSNRVGITIAKNTFNRGRDSELEESIYEEGLHEKMDLLRIDSFDADSVTEDRIIEGIRYLVEE